MAAKKDMQPDGESTAMVAVKAQTMQGWNAVSNMAEAVQLAEIIGKSNALPDVRNVAVALLKIMAGGEMGFGPFASLVDVHIIEGKPAIGAHLRAAAIKRSGKYDYVIKRCDRDACELEFLELRAGKWQPLGTVEMTIEEAIASGLTQGKNGMKANWKNHPDDMLFARCISKGYRRYCPDLTGGVLAYDPDELDSAPVPVAVQATVTAATVDAPKEYDGSTVPVRQGPELISEYQVERLGELISQLGITEAQWTKAYQSRGVQSARELTRDQASEMIRNLESRLEKKQAG